jgi:hypothetical protein
MKNMTFKKKMASILLSILVVSCSDQAPPNDGLAEIKNAETTTGQTVEQEIPEESPAPPSSHETEFAVFAVEPGHVSACPGKDRTVSKVSWSVKDPNVVTVKVLLNSDEDKNFKLFTMGGATGSADTGEWVGSGVKFYLVDASTGKQLATHEVTMLPCVE